MTNLQRVRQYMCDWTDWDTHIAHLLRLAQNGTALLPAVVTDSTSGLITSHIDSNAMHIPPQHALYYPFPPTETLSAAQFCATLTVAFVQREKLSPFLHNKNQKKPQKHPWASATKLLPPPTPTAGLVLRIGFMSAQYGDNSLGWTMEHVFALHDR